MSRSCTCCRYDGQEVDRGSPRARDPCTNAAVRAEGYDCRGLATSEKQKKTETAYKPEPRKESVPLVGDGFDEYTGEPDDVGAR